MSTVIEFDLDKLQHVSQDLVRDLDAKLAEAIRSVEDGEVAAATVGLTFSVGPDKEGRTEVNFSLKGATNRKGSFNPAASGQLRLVTERE